MPQPSPHPDDAQHRSAKQRQLLAKLWNESQHAIGAFVRAAVPSTQDAEDIVQQVAENAAFHFDKYDPDRPFVAWAIGIARNLVADHYRRQGKDRHRFDSQILDTLAIAGSQMADDRRERNQALEACLGGLQGHSRQFIDLRYTHDLKPQQIAERIGSTSGSVRVTLNRIRTALRRCIQERIDRGPMGHISPEAGSVPTDDFTYAFNQWGLDR